LVYYPGRNAIFWNWIATSFVLCNIFCPICPPVCRGEFELLVSSLDVESIGQCLIPGKTHLEKRL
jgi:hypothetical protein